jgi:hypothetical protein
MKFVLKSSTDIPVCELKFHFRHRPECLCYPLVIGINRPNAIRQIPAKNSFG